MVVHLPHGLSMKYLTLALLYTVCSPLVLADNPVLGDLVDIPNLSPDAQFCELGKPKSGKFTGLERCEKGDVLFYKDVVKAENAAHLVRLCEWGTFTLSQQRAKTFSTWSESFALCIYRGSEMPIRE